jgi:ferredoxin
VKVVVDREICQSYGLCELTAPAIFRVGDDGFAEPLIAGDLPAELRGLAVEGAEMCPVHALRVE